MSCTLLICTMCAFMCVVCACVCLCEELITCTLWLTMHGVSSSSSFQCSSLSWKSLFFPRVTYPGPKQRDTQMQHEILLTRFNSFSVFYLNKCQLMLALIPRCPVGSSILTSSGSTENRSVIQPFRQVRLVRVSSLLIKVIYSFYTLTRAQVRVALMGAAKTTAVSHLWVLERGECSRHKVCTSGNKRRRRRRKKSFILYQAPSSESTTWRRFIWVKGGFITAGLMHTWEKCIQILY